MHISFFTHKKVCQNAPLLSFTHKALTFTNFHKLGLCYYLKILYL
ncbi:hypothetical protein BFGS084_04065 [Bacteroides fragilis]|nr:hypothetical protein BFGS084_04065 [Bacteroides fragilis]